MFKRIVVPLDGSELAEAILPKVEDLARLHGSEVILLRVALAHTLPGADPIEAQVRVVEEAERYIGYITERLESRGLAAKGVVRYGEVATEILDHVQEVTADLVAMSTHGRSGVTRWLLGSVAEKVLRGSPVPVLLVRAPGAPR